jgi:beta-phosphoglucomutase-like phosphatase (HAD superfamily)
MLRDRMIAVLAEEVEAVPGAMAAWQAVAALGVPQRVASNSSHQEMQVKFARTGLDALVAGRVHSARDVNRGKPDPALFLFAAAAEGVAPADCLVIEDSIPGVRAARAAGMACAGFDPHGDGGHLREAGATVIINSLADVPGLVRQGMETAR